MFFCHLVLFLLLIVGRLDTTYLEQEVDSKRHKKMEILAILAVCVLALVPVAVGLKADRAPVRVKVETKKT